VHFTHIHPDIILACGMNLGSEAPVGVCANPRLDYPDFVARLESGEHWLLETKARRTST
jgi:hypothetical protein